MASPDGSLLYRRLLTADQLRAWYVDEGRSVEWIAGRIGCSATAVHAAIDRHSIPRRGHARGGPLPRWGDVLTADYLQQRYVEDGATILAIAVEVGCSASTVQRFLRRHSIEARPASRGGRPLYGEEAHEHS